MTGEWWEYLVVFCASTSICLVLTPVAMAVAVRNDVFDQPRGHKSHDSPVPYLGGVAIIVAFAASVIGAALIYPPESGVGELWVVEGYSPSVPS